MDLGIMSLNSFGDDNVPPTSSSRSVFNLEPSDFWRGSKSGPVNPFRLEPESKLQRSAPSLLADDAPADSFSISFTSPVSGPLSNAASYTDSHKQGCGSGGGSTGGMHGLFTRCREPFTPSQWLDLELQALIYKYIVANVPVPSHLLYQIRKSLNPFLYVGSSTSYAPYSFGWAPFRLGLSGSNDPEPGRCRRTDGKKWRCAKEAVPDQKYCERHINRGRHRSRKPVESRKGLVLAGTNNAMEASVASSMSEASVMSSNGTPKSLSLLQQQCKSLQSNAANPSANVVLERVQGQTIKSPTVDIKSEDSRLSFLPQHVGTEGPPMQEFGLVSSTSLLYTSDKRSCTDSRIRDVFLSFNKQDAQNEQPLHRFMDDWPKNQSERLTVGWSEEFKSDWTQLSMSIPKNSSTFSTCSNSRREKFTVMPSELDPTNMNLAMQYDRSEKQTSWIPVTWENSLGGPLGEALHSTSTSVEAGRSSLMLNLTNREFWDSHSKVESSPTGVLQKTTLVSVSSSAGSSPRGGNHVGGSSVPDDVPCSALVSIPSL